MVVLSLTIFIYCLCVCADCRFLPVSADEETFQTLCSRTCHSSKNSSDSFIPPYQCSCSPSCTVFGDCCYDSPYKYTSSPIQVQFVCLHVEGTGEYQAVLGCPPHIRSDSCREKFGHMPPLTSRITNVTYGNVFCATCNEDDEDLVTWNVQLRCPSDDDWLDFTRKVNNMYNLWSRYTLERNWSSCTFNTQNEDGILNGLELRICDVPQMVTRCSTTWTEPDTDQKCRSYEDPVYVGNTLFRNSHCAECNYKNLSHAECIPRVAKEMLEEGRVDKNYIRDCMTTPPYSCFSKLFRNIQKILWPIFDPDYTAFETSETGCILPKGERCCEGERYDDWTGGCRKIRIVHKDYEYFS